MPKEASNIEEEVVRAPRKRAPRRVAVPKTTRSPRARVATGIRSEETESADESVRRAPTRLPDNTSKGRQFTFKTAIKIFIPLVIVGATLWIGFSDSGQIDVNAKISDRNTDFAASDNASGMVHVPVQNAPTVPNGGLVGQGILNPPTNLVPASPATSTETTASTTETASEDSATSSEPVVEERADENTTDGAEVLPPTEEGNTENPPIAS